MVETPILSTFVLVSAGTTLVLAVALSFFIKRNSISEGSEEVPGRADSCDNSVEDDEIYPGGVITIVYGSQSGTGESFANDLGNDVRKLGFKPNLVDAEVDDKESNEVQDMLAKANKDESGKSKTLFIISTYGEGEPTDNTIALVKLLRERTGVESMSRDSVETKLDPDWLSGMEYAVFGLGSTEYEHFNSNSKFFDKSLEKAGGKRIMDLVLGDDAKDIEEDFTAWKEKILPVLRSKYVDTKNVDDEPPVVEIDLPACAYDITYNSAVTSSSTSPIPNSSKFYFQNVQCSVKANRELITENKASLSTRHIEIDIVDKISYKTADNLAVLPVNQTHVIEAVASAFSYNLDDTFYLRNKDDNKILQNFPSPCTIREYLQLYADLSTPLRRSELKKLALFATKELDRAALLRLSSKEGKAEYQAKIQEPHIGFAEIVTRLCPSVMMPLEHLISIVPKLQPRYYTIASSSSTFPNSVHMTVAVVNSKRDDGTEHKGVCSNHLKDASEGEMVRCFVRPSSFRLPADASIPILLIGPGTGIAPMRALLQERSHQKSAGINVGSTILYFGCKHQSVDFLYRDELVEFEKEGVLSKLHTAFSRDQEQKEYVQHLIAKNCDEIWDLVEAGVYIYICGGVRMGSDVCDTIRDIIMKKKGGSTEEAKEFFKELQGEGRVVQELWA